MTLNQGFESQVSQSTFVRAIMNIVSTVHVVAQELRVAQAQVGLHRETPLPASVVFEHPWEPEALTTTPLSLKCSESMLSHHVATELLWQLRQ